MTQNKLVGFCYLFIIGIALAMAFPAGPGWVAPAWWGTAALGAASVAVLVLLRKHRPPTEDLSPWGEEFRFDKWHAAAWAVLAATALVFGYARYLSMIQSPDRLLGTVDLNSSLEWKGREMTTTSFLKLKVLDDVAEDASLRISGELEALQPMLDYAGTPVMDANGNWNFTQTDTDQATEEIILEKGTRAGTEIVIDQPFTRVDKVETVKTPKGRLRVAVYQPVNTVALFARRGRNTVPVKLLGRIAADPWVYSFKTVLSVAPDYLQYAPDGPYFKVERQTVRVTVDPEVPVYDAIARSDAYGYDVAVSGQLIAPNGAANAGSFDQAKYLRNYNIGGQMSLKGGADGGRPLDIVVPAGAQLPREGNGLVEFSLYLRDSMVRVIKQTMPQPNSAFLGALTLGLRYGMQNTVTIASDDYQDGAVKPLLDLGEGDADDLIADEFRASGINHVLAVSGLHVTIITVMFMGIFTLLKISKKVYVPFVIFALTVFAIITGARPSTLRAVIMNSLFLLTWGYMGQGVRASALLGVPVAAFMILVQNPAMAVDPSFTLSFGAILSLALLTQPFFDIFKKFEGNNFVALCGVLAVLTYAFAAHWLLVATLRFWVFLALVAAGLFAGARWLDKKGIHLIGNYGFADIPVGVSGFIAAQFGMQVGMMIPLSAYYFARWPVAGAYANLIAIPLVGVVLQLSMLAGLIGLIPGIGIYLALLLNAANWIFSTGFLLIGHYFAKWFTYPFVRKPTLAWIFAYYAALAVFVWWRPLWFRTLRPRWRHWGNAAKFLCIVAACAVVGGVVWGLEEQKRGLAPEGVAEINVLSVGYGSAVLLRTPDGRHVLVDTGFVQTDRGRRNEADRTILPFMSANRALRLDGVVVTGPGREHTDGLATVLEHCKIDTLYYPASAAPVLEEGDVADVLKERDASRVKHALGGTGLKKAMISAGDRLFECEGPDGKLFYVEVLGPRGGDGQAPATLRVVYGDFAMLLCGDLTMEQQQALLRECADGQLRAQVVTAPAHGTAGLERVNAGMPKNYARDLEQVTGALLKKTGAEAVVFEFGNPRPACGEKYKLAVKLHGAAKRAAEDALPEARILATDLDGGVRIATDGTEWTLSAQFDGDGSDTDAPTSLEVGW